MGLQAFEASVSREREREGGRERERERMIPCIYPVLFQLFPYLHTM